MSASPITLVQVLVTTYLSFCKNFIIDLYASLLNLFKYMLYSATRESQFHV